MKKTAFVFIFACAALLASAQPLQMSHIPLKTIAGKAQWIASCFADPAGNAWLEVVLDNGQLKKQLVRLNSNWQIDSTIDVDLPGKGFVFDALGNLWYYTSRYVYIHTPEGVRDVFTRTEMKAPAFAILTICPDNKGDIFFDVQKRVLLLQPFHRHEAGL